jgi:transcriptional regulator with XRE-family HTH domain
MLGAQNGEDILVRFGNRVRELRRATGASQEEFAFRCDLDRTYISGIERGRRNVSLRNLVTIAQALDVTLSQLFDGLER